MCKKCARGVQGREADPSRVRVPLLVVELPLPKNGTRTNTAPSCAARGPPCHPSQLQHTLFSPSSVTQCCDDGRIRSLPHCAVHTKWGYCSAAGPCHLCAVHTKWGYCSAAGPCHLLQRGTSGGNGCKDCLPGYSPVFCGGGGTHCALRTIHGDTNGDVHDGIIGCDGSLTVTGAIEAR